MCKITNKLRRAAALLLCCCLLMAAFPAAAFAEDAQEFKDPVHISTVAELKKLAADCRLDSWSQNRTVLLDNDIDLTGSGFSGIPTFGGVFEGQNHTISGLTITFDSSICGLFRHVQQSGMVRNLTVSGRVMPTGTRNTAGGIVGSNAGTLQNCTYKGIVSAASTAGGIAGVNTGLITACQTAGMVYGSHFIGGIVGDNSGVVSGCANECNVNTTVQQNEVSLPDITLEDLTHTEAANEITDVGGVAGTSSGVLRACINRGVVGYEHIGYNVGGIAGSQTGYIEGCVNYAQIYGRKEVGGIVGQMEPNSVLQYSADTLQTLEGQLNTLQALMNKAANDAEATSNDATAKLNALQGQVTNARSTVEQLLTQVRNGISLSSTTITTDMSKLFPEPDIKTSGSGTEPSPTPEPTETPEPTLPPLPTELPELSPLPTILPELSPLPIETPTPAPEAPAEQAVDEAPTEADTADAAQAAPHERPAKNAALPSLSPLPEISPLPTALPEVSPLPSALPTELPSASPLPTLMPELMAQEVVDALRDELPDSVSLEVPSLEINNQDAITAAQNDLSSNLTGIADGVTALNASGAGNAQALISDMRAINAQVNLIGNTLTGAANKIQSTDVDAVLQDVSDEDTDADTEGKVYNCINAGAINGDLNVGGISGAMAPENDLDPEDDVNVSGSNSLNFTYKTRVVVRACSNRGTITAKKQCAGGITGLMELGTAYYCSNTGTLECDGADYVGGIAGESKGAVRSCYVKSTLQGNNYLGGVAGSGAEISDCRTMVSVAVGNESLGAIAGATEEDATITGNYFVSESLGGIDGVSYAGAAEPLDYADFVALPDMADIFSGITVRFVADGATVAAYTLAYGAKFADSEIPAVPQKDGYYGEWTAFDGNHVTFDATVTAVYTPLHGVLESPQKRGDRAIMLAEGNFTGETDLFLMALAQTPLLAAGETEQDAWTVSMPQDGNESHTVHYLPAGALSSTAIYLRSGSSWRRADTTVDGSYLVFTMQTNDDALCATTLPAATAPLWLQIAGGAAAVLLLGVILRKQIKKRKSKRKSKAVSASDKKDEG